MKTVNLRTALVLAVVCIAVVALFAGTAFAGGGNNDKSKAGLYTVAWDKALPLGGHAAMATTFPYKGTPCAVCHNGAAARVAPNISSMPKVNMGGKPCAKCHNGDKAFKIFLVNGLAGNKCSDCHVTE